MREQIEVKLKQAQEQQMQWQRNLAAAQEQTIRWDAIRLFCEELLAMDVPIVMDDHEGIKGHEENEANTAS